MMLRSHVIRAHDLIMRRYEKLFFIWLALSSHCSIGYLTRRRNILCSSTTTPFYFQGLIEIVDAYCSILLISSTALPKFFP